MEKGSYLLSKISSPQTNLVKNTCKYLKDNIADKHMLDSIALSMGTNRSKLAASFKIVLSMSVFEYLRKIRMEKARELLIYTTLPIQEISFDVGYENSANFSTSYKKYHQISPREQRSMYCSLDEIFSNQYESINDDLWCDK